LTLGGLPALQKGSNNILANFDVFHLPGRFRPLTGRLRDEAQHLESPGLSGIDGSYGWGEACHQFCWH